MKKCTLNKYIYHEIKKEIESFGFNVVSHDFERPWGGFLVIDESQVQDFSNKFFYTYFPLSFPNVLNRSINTSATASLFGFSPI